MMIEWKKSDTFESSPCDPMKCNPKCPQCGDTPSCGDGSWSWGHGKHRHRCRDAHPQSGHDDVLCNTHDGPFIIDRLTRENADHAAELARVEGERDNALEAARVAIEQMDRWRLVAQAGATMQTQTLTENNLIRQENTLLRAECEAWRAWWDAELPIDLNKPDMYQDVACARQATDAAGILKGAE